MENQFDYYLISDNNAGNVPLLVNDDEFDSFGIGVLSQCRTMSPDFVGHIAFGPPIPPKPRLSDAMDLRGDCCVFSKKICDALSQHEIKGLQLVPAVIRGKNGETFDNYFIANTYQKMAFFDEGKTEFKRISKITGEWQNIKKIVLDKELLASVPLEDRLVFVSKEYVSFVLYHKSVVDIIMSANPEGVAFIPVEEWYDGVQFA